MKFNEKKTERKKLTEDERSALAQARAKARDEEKKVAEALAPRLPKMSHRQLRGEIKRVVREDSHKEGFVPGLRIAFATCLLTVLDNTQTKENPFAKLSCYVR